MIGTDIFSVVSAGIVGLMLVVPVSLFLRGWRQRDSRRQQPSSKDVYYCNGVPVSVDDLDSRV